MPRFGKGPWNAERSAFEQSLCFDGSEEYQGAQGMSLPSLMLLFAKGPWSDEARTIVRVAAQHGLKVSQQDGATCKFIVPGWDANILTAVRSDNL